MKRRILAMLLSLAMVLTMLPVTAFAAEDTLADLNVTVTDNNTQKTLTVKKVGSSGSEEEVSNNLYYFVSETRPTAPTASDGKFTVLTDGSSGDIYKSYETSTGLTVTNELYVAVVVTEGQAADGETGKPITVTAFGTAPIVAPTAIDFTATISGSTVSLKDSSNQEYSVPTGAKVNVSDDPSEIPATKDQTACTAIKDWNGDASKATENQYIVIAVLDDTSSPTEITSWGIAQVTSGESGANEITVSKEENNNNVSGFGDDGSATSTKVAVDATDGISFTVKMTSGVPVVKNSDAVVDATVALVDGSNDTYTVTIAASELTDVEALTVSSTNAAVIIGDVTANTVTGATKGEVKTATEGKVELTLTASADGQMPKVTDSSDGAITGVEIVPTATANQWTVTIPAASGSGVQTVKLGEKAAEDATDSNLTVEAQNTDGNKINLTIKNNNEVINTSDAGNYLVLTGTDANTALEVPKLGASTTGYKTITVAEQLLQIDQVTDNPIVKVLVVEKVGSRVLRASAEATVSPASTAVKPDIKLYAGADTTGTDLLATAQYDENSKTFTVANAVTDATVTVAADGSVAIEEPASGATVEDKVVTLATGQNKIKVTLTSDTSTPYYIVVTKQSTTSTTPTIKLYSGTDTTGAEVQLEEVESQTNQYTASVTDESVTKVTLAITADGTIGTVSATDKDGNALTVNDKTVTLATTGDTTITFTVGSTNYKITVTKTTGGTAAALDNITASIDNQNKIVISGDTTTAGAKYYYALNVAADTIASWTKETAFDAEVFTVEVESGTTEAPAKKTTPQTLIVVKVVDNKLVAKSNVVTIDAESGSEKTPVTSVVMTLNVDNLTTASSLPQPSVTATPADSATATAEWYKGTTVADVTEANKVTSFTAAGAYIAKITVTPANNYELTNDTTYTLNEDSTVTVTAGTLTVTADVKAGQSGDEGDKEISKVAITLGTADLKVGSKIPTTAATTEANVTLGTAKWLLDNEPVTGTEFATKGTYKVQIPVTANAGYKLADNVAITIDDVAATVTKEGVAEIEVTVAEAASDTNTTVETGTEVDPTDETKVTGAVTEDEVTDAVDAAAADEKADKVELTFTAPEDAENIEKVNVSIPKTAVEAVATAQDSDKKDKNLSLVVNTPVGSVELPSAEVKSINEQVKEDADTANVVLVIEPAEKENTGLTDTEAAKITVYDIEFRKEDADGEKVEVNSPVNVSLKTAAADTDKLVVYLIEKQPSGVAKKTPVAWGVSPKKGFVHFRAMHLSMYGTALVTDDSTPAEPEVKIDGETLDFTEVEGVPTVSKDLPKDAQVIEIPYIADNIVIKKGTVTLDEGTDYTLETKDGRQVITFKTLQPGESAAVAFDYKGETYVINATVEKDSTPVTNKLKVEAEAVKMEGVPTHQKLTVTGGATGSRYVISVMFKSNTILDTNRNRGYFMFTSDDATVIVPQDQKGYNVEVWEFANGTTGPLIENGSVVEGSIGRMAKADVAAGE